MIRVVQMPGLAKLTPAQRKEQDTVPVTQPKMRQK